MQRKALYAALAGVVLLLSACGSAGSGSQNSSNSSSSSNSATGSTTGSSSGSGSSSTSTASSYTVKAASTKLGTILVNAKGMTLYRYTADTSSKSGCTWSGCTALWPPLAVQGTPTAGPGLTGKLGVITGPTGSKMATYAGWPLYTYAGDTKAGQTNGQGVKDQAGVWYVVYAKASKNPAPKS